LKLEIEKTRLAHLFKWRSKPCPLLPHRGFEDTACFDLWLATFHILEMLYDTPFPDEPQTDHIEKTERNAEIITRYEAGETGASLAQAYGISEQRVNQIVRRKRK
jgi:phage terminase Nu1 subunit (DNA packaging protein)